MVKGQKAGTALRTMFTNLSKPTKAMKDKMDELGISITDSNGEMRPMRDVMDQLRDKMGGLSKEQQAAAASTIFGKEAMSGALAIVNASQEDYDKLAHSIDNSKGASKRMADTMEKGLGGSLRELKSAAQELGLSVFDTVQPALSSMVGGIKKGVDYLNKMPKGAKVAAVGLGVVAAATGPVLLSMGLLLRAVSSAAKGYAFLNRRMAVNSAEATINAAANQGAAVSMAHTGKRTKGLTGLLGGFGKASKTTAGKTGLLKKGVGLLGKSFKFLGGPVGWTITGVSLLVGAFKQAYKNVDWFRDGINGLGEVIKVFGGNVINGATDKFKQLGGWIDDTTDKVKNGLSKQLQKEYKNLEDDDLMKIAGDKFKSFMDILGTAGNKATDTTKVLGKGVSKETKGALGKYLKYSSESTRILEDIKLKHGEVTDKQANELIQKTDAITNELIGKLEERREKELKIAEEAAGKNGYLDAKLYEKVLQATNQFYDDKEQAAKESSKRIAELNQKAQTAGLTDKELEEYQNLLNKQKDIGIEALTKSEEEQQKITSRVKANAEALTIQQASEMLKRSNKALKQTKKDAEERYEARLIEIENMKGLSDEEKDKLIQNAEEQKNETIKKSEEKHEEVKKGVQKHNRDIETEIDLSNGKVYSNVEKWWNKFMGWLEITFTGIGSWLIRKGVSMFSYLKLGWDTALNNGFDLWLSVTNKLGETWEITQGWFNARGQNIQQSFKNGWNSAWDRAGNIWGRVTRDVSNTWDNVKSSTQEKLEGARKTVVNQSIGISKATGKWFGEAYSKAKDKVTGIYHQTKEKYGSTKDKAWSGSKSVWKGTSKWFGKAYDSAKSKVGSIYNKSKEKYNQTKDKAWNASKSVWKGTSKWFGEAYSSVKSKLGNMWKTSKTNFGNIASEGWSKAKFVYKGFKKWLGETLQWIKDIGKDMGRAASDLGKGVANKAIDGLNGMIGGVNKISKAITDKTLIKKIPRLSTGTYDGSTLATDNYGGLKQSTLAMVNDRGRGNASGGGVQEVIHRADGTLEAPKGRNALVHLDKGDGVINARDTKRYQSMGMLPRFHKGTKKKKDDLKGIITDKVLDLAGGFKEGASKTAQNIKKKTEKGLEKVSDVTKKGASWLGDKIGDVWDYISNPKKLVNKVLDGIGINFGKGQNATVKMAKGAYHKLKASLVDKVKSMFDEFGGSGDGGYIDLSRGINFGFARTAAEAARMGYPFRRAHHGLDINYSYGSKLYSTLAGTATAKSGYNGGYGNSVWIKSPGGIEAIYGHMSELAFSGSKKVKPGTFLGLSGGDPSRQGASAGDSTGPHLHYEMRWNGVPKDPTNWLKSNNGVGGKGAAYARRVIQQAQQILGDKYKGKYILNNMMKLAKRESNYDAKAVNNWDSNARAGTPSKGLFQMIQPTFAANAKKGFSNFGNPVHQAISAIRYIERTYGWGGFPRAAAYAYENGGIARKHQIAEISEKNRPEAIVPLHKSKRGRALQLIEQIMSHIGYEKGKVNVNVNNDNSTIEKLLQQVVQLSETNNRMQQMIIKLLSSNNKNINKKDFIDAFSQLLGNKANLDNFNQGF